MMTTMLDRRVTVTEIAQLAKVTVPAVSNWRKRYQDFPAAVDVVPSGDLFDLSSVLAWLELHGRGVQVGVPSVERALWDVANTMRDALTIDEVVLVTLQVVTVYWWTARDAQHRALPSRPDWYDLRADGPRVARQRWSDLARAVDEQFQGRLARALELPHGLTDHALYNVIERVTSLPIEGVAWGSVASAFLRRAHDTLAARAGEIATPASLTSLMVQLLAPVAGVVYDPAAGHAMVLAEAARQRGDADVRLVGQEVADMSRRIGILHLALQGISFDLESGDTLRDDRYPSLRADRIAVEPPFGQKLHAADNYFDERWRFGTTNAGEWMWAQHLVFHLAEDGIGVITAPVGSLSRAGRDARVRRGIVEADVLDAVIELPPGLIPGTNVALALLVFARGRRNRAGRVLFVDARQLGLVRRGRANELTLENVERVVDLMTAWREGRIVEEPLFASVAMTDAIVATEPDSAAEAVLTPHRFVRYAAPAQAGDHAAAVEHVARASATAARALENIAGLSERVRGAVAALRPTSDVHWPVVKLGNLLTDRPQTGTRLDADGTDEPRPWVASRLVSGGTGRLTRVPEDMTRGRVKGRPARRGDLLLASRGIEAGGRIACATVDVGQELAFAESLMRLSPDASRVHSDYLRFALTSQSGRTALAAVTTGSVIGNLRPDALEEVEVRLPPLEIQYQTVAALRTVEDAAAQLAGALDASRALLDTVRDEVVVGHYSAGETQPVPAAAPGRRKRARASTDATPSTPTA